VLKTNFGRLAIMAASLVMGPAAMAEGEPAKTDGAAPPPAAAEAAKPAEQAAPAAEGAPVTPFDRVKATDKGALKNPYTDNPEAIAEGKKFFFSNSCNGCHGGGGGGGMCPPLTNEIWVYGSDDDTLFRLITLGSQDLQKDGYKRKGGEGVVGPMPPYKDIITDETKLWKIIAWVRTLFKGDPKRRNW